MPDTQGVRIQNFLESLARGFDFKNVVYADGTSTATVTIESVSLETNQVNEISCSFREDKRNGRDVVRERDGWRFQQILRFQKEVTFDAFVEGLINPVPRMVPTTDQLGVLLKLENMEIKHKARHNPRTGTEATITFIATEMRR